VRVFKVKKKNSEKEWIRKHVPEKGSSAKAELPKEKLDS
jgi:hypothetical protein